MSLSQPAPRRHIHTRKIECHGYLREDGLWDIEGTLIDLKTYSFDNIDRGGVVAGEPVSSLAPYCNAETPKFQTHDTLDKVLTYLIEHNQHAVIVMKEEKLAGIYTSHDALVHLRKLLRELYPEDDNAA